MGLHRLKLKRLGLPLLKCVLLGKQRGSAGHRILSPKTSKKFTRTTTCMSHHSVSKLSRGKILLQSAPRGQANLVTRAASTTGQTCDLSLSQPTLMWSIIEEAGSWHQITKLDTTGKNFWRQLQRQTILLRSHLDTGHPWCPGPNKKDCPSLRTSLLLTRSSKSVRSSAWSWSSSRLSRSIA